MKLRQWSFVSSGDPYQAPELRNTQLKGEVYGHPDRPDGSYIHTSNVVKVSGRKVTTHSGSVYTLDGEPHFLYAQWCKEFGLSPIPKRKTRKPKEPTNATP